MTLFCSFNALYVILPVVFAQYVLATVTLVRLAQARLKTSAYVLWNIAIMLIFFLGSAAFLIYDSRRRNKAAARESSGAVSTEGSRAVSMRQQSVGLDVEEGGNASEEKGGGQESSKWDV